MWNVAVETADNFVFEAFGLSGVFGVHHRLRESPDLLAGKLTGAEVFSDKSLNLLLLVVWQASDFLDDLEGAHLAKFTGAVSRSKLKRGHCHSRLPLERYYDEFEFFA